MTYKVRKIMKREYVAILLGGFITAMTASGASYIGTQKNLSANNVRIDTVEKSVDENREVHKGIYVALKELNDTNQKMQLTLTKIATVIEIKLGEKSGSKKE